MSEPTDRRARVIDALIAGMTATAAAQQCGVARRTHPDGERRTPKALPVRDPRGDG
jgi:hypothetical protein